MSRTLVTGAAGFIGFFLARRLLDDGVQVVGIDNLNDYYDPQLKQSRLDRLSKDSGFRFHKLDIADRTLLSEFFERESFDRVVHLAAQAGVRYSLEAPQDYIDSNIVAFGNMLECCRHHPPEHLVYASSSSVYGSNTDLPFSAQDPADHPLSLYGATKRANELMAHCYSYLYGLKTTGLRFFTVYGPWGRPDMALFRFVKAIIRDDPIHVFNEGKMVRDFTYVDDVVEGIMRVLDRPAEGCEGNGAAMDPSRSQAPFRIYNIGNSQPVPLMKFIESIEKALGKKARILYREMQPGDVVATHADVTELARDFDYRPSTRVDQGVANFVRWYRDYYNF